jgi:hypothetical protein
MNWHIEVMAAKLENCRQGKIRQLIINIPPRHLNCASVRRRISPTGSPAIAAR